MPQSRVRVWLQSRIGGLQRNDRPDPYMVALNLIFAREYTFPVRFRDVLRTFHAAISTNSRSIESIALASAILTFAGFGPEVEDLRCANREVELVYLVYFMLVDIRSQRGETEQDHPPAYVEGGQTRDVGHDSVFELV